MLYLYIQRRLHNMYIFYFLFECNNYHYLRFGGLLAKFSENIAYIFLSITFNCMLYILPPVSTFFILRGVSIINSTVCLTPVWNVMLNNRGTHWSDFSYEIHLFHHCSVFNRSIFIFYFFNIIPFRKDTFNVFQMTKWLLISALMYFKLN